MHPSLKEAITARGWKSLTDLQIEAYQAIVEGYNVLIVAPTGEGKTEAALIPVLSRIASDCGDGCGLKVLYITPMKALINDIYSRIQWWAERLGFVVARKHGDTPQSERNRRLRKTPNILVLTPESLEIDLDIARRFRQQYKSVEYVIIDEVHELLSTKRGLQLLLLLERLVDIAGRDIQRIGISATIGSPEAVLRIMSGSSRRPMKVVASRRKKEPRIKVKLVEYGADYTVLLGEIMAETSGASIVFVNSRYMAESLKKEADNRGLRKVYVHHSSVSPEVRAEAEDVLRKGEGVVIATKSLELGIDVGLVDRIVQVEPPGSPITLLQRIGRSRHRIGENPEGVIIAGGDIELAESLAEALMAVEGRMDPLEKVRAPIDVVSREIIGIILEKGQATPERVHKILSGSPIYKYSEDRVRRLMEIMASTGILRKSEGGYRIGRRFYMIWRFNKDSKNWWSKSFSEFFTTMSDKESYTVVNNGSIIGDIDSYYVWRHLRIGDVIRLSGSSWRITNIDHNSGVIDVVADEGEAVVPLWRGDNVRRSRSTAVKMFRVIKKARDDWGSIASKIETGAREAKSIIRIAEWYEKRGLPLPDEDTAIYESRDHEEIIIHPFGSGASEALALLVADEALRRHSLQVYYRSSFYGFSVTSRGELLDIIRSIDPRSLEERLVRAVKRSPYMAHYQKDAKLMLGVIGSGELDDFILDDIAWFIVETHLDIEYAREFIRKLREGSIRVYKAGGSGLSPFSARLLEMPQVKPWVPGIIDDIARMLENYAFTIVELSEALGVSEKVIESKLKDMRGPSYGDRRVVSFIDLDEGERRWTLASSLEYVSRLEEFEGYFKPEALDTPLRLRIKHSRSGASQEIIVTPASVMRDWESIERMLPEEIFLAEISNAYYDDEVVRHYNVSAKILPLLILNAAAYLERPIY